MELHHKRYPKSPLPIVYPLVIYTGEKLWDAPRVIYDLFGDQRELAKEVLLQPYQLIDIHRVDDTDLRNHLLSGLVEFVLKYRKVRDFGIFLEMFFPWLTETETHTGGPQLSKIMLEYVFSKVNAKDVKLFIMKSEEYLSPTLRGEAMTLAQLFEQNGLNKGIQQEKYQLAMKLLKDGMPLQKVAELTELPIKTLLAEQAVYR
jgi:predicted transposase/invertase (TIGR01784 family)